jgi:hypothetical protein
VARTKLLLVSLAAVHILSSCGSSSSDVPDTKLQTAASSSSRCAGSIGSFDITLVASEQAGTYNLTITARTIAVPGEGASVSAGSKELVHEVALSGNFNAGTVTDFDLNSHLIIVPVGSGPQPDRDAVCAFPPAP